MSLRFQRASTRLKHLDQYRCTFTAKPDGNYFLIVSIMSFFADYLLLQLHSKFKLVPAHITRDISLQWFLNVASGFVLITTVICYRM